MLSRESTKTKYRNIKRYGSVMLIIAVIVSFSLLNWEVSSDHIIAAPEYPGKIGFNDVDEKRNRREYVDKAFLSRVKEFSYESASLILKQEDSNTNCLYSPISLYMALAMMAETAQGDTHQEILKAIKMNDVNMIGQETGKLFRSLHFHNEIGRLSLANSLWLNEDIKFNKNLLDKMASDYYTHSFQVDFSKDDTSRKISEWVSKYTGGKLGNNSDDFPVDRQQVMSLFNTVYFYDEWVDRFNADQTAGGAFYLADGSTVDCDFMNKTYISHSFAGAEGYTVSGLSFKNSCSMIFILPDEGVSPMNIISDPQLLSEALNSLVSQQRQFGKVIFKIPKFNYESQLDLRSSIEKLGIKSAFDSDTADFSLLSETKPLFVSDIKQSTSIAIDENGCEAAAFTQIHYVGAARPDGTAEMILDRPFIFAITGADRCPLFIGIINNPNVR